MLATSWLATGLLKPIWLSLDVSQGHAKELARLTGIPANDLYALNNGTKVMTLARAEKIIAAVSGFTVADLRPAEPPISQREARRLRDHLEELARLVGRGFLALGATPEQLQPPEENPGQAEDP